MLRKHRSSTFFGVVGGNGYGELGVNGDGVDGIDEVDEDGEEDWDDLDDDDDDDDLSRLNRFHCQCQSNLDDRHDGKPELEFAEEAVPGRWRFFRLPPESAADAPGSLISSYNDGVEGDVPGLRCFLLRQSNT